MENKKDYFFRVISNQVRFGCGYRTVNGRRQYFAWHGYPNRDSDYFTTAEISESEFNEINEKYNGEMIEEEFPHRWLIANMNPHWNR